jgi:Spy/CpxP family protein refolding chaperone
MNRTKTLKMMAAGLAVVAMGTLSACKCHKGQGHDPEKMKQHVTSSLKKIGATEEQQKNIGVVSDRIIADGSELYQSNQGLGKKVVGCLLLDQPNKGWLHQTVDDKAREMTAFAHRTVDSLIEISAMLTPEQRKNLSSRYEDAHGTK